MTTDKKALHIIAKASINPKEIENAQKKAKEDKNMKNAKIYRVVFETKKGRGALYVVDVEAKNQKEAKDKVKEMWKRTGSSAHQFGIMAQQTDELKFDRFCDVELFMRAPSSREAFQMFWAKFWRG